MKLKLYIIFFIPILFVKCSQKEIEYSFPDVNNLPVINGLCNPLQMYDGTLVENKNDWEEQRKYLKEMLARTSKQ